MNIEKGYWRVRIAKSSCKLIFYFNEKDHKADKDYRYDVEFIYDLATDYPLPIGSLTFKMNGIEINMLPAISRFNESSLRVAFAKKLRVLQIRLFKDLMPRIPVDVAVQFIFSDFSIINMAIEVGDAFEEFDSTFLHSLKANTFMEAAVALEEVIKSVMNEDGTRKVNISDSVIFEDYLLIGNITTDYYGFLDNEHPEDAQKIFSIPTALLLDIMPVILSINISLSSKSDS